MSFRNILLVAGVSLIVSGAGARAHTDVTVEQARDLVDTTDDLVVVDVREPSEYCDARGHIPGAVNYPLNTGVLQARYEELPMDGPILVVCRSGGRSNVAATFLDSAGFSAVYDMMGGMNAWTGETERCKYSGGSGTANDPYRIATATDLIALGETPEDYDKHFILTADIDFGRRVFDRAVIAPETSLMDGWFERTPFSGVFDGNGHTISGLTCRSVSPMETSVGLFGTVDPNAEIKNLGLIDPQVDAAGVFATGSLAGFSSGTLRNCYVEGGSVTGQDGYVGGLVGYNRGRMIACYSATTVAGDSYVGGLAGGNYSWIVHCYSTSAVSGQGDVGGLVGYNAGCITDTYSAGPVEGEGSVGGLVGRTMGSGRSGGSAEINSFWDVETSGLTQSAGGTGLSTEQMYDPHTFMALGWDFVGLPDGPHDVWAPPLEGAGYPILHWQLPTDFGLPAFSGGTGEPDDPYLISSPADWNLIGHNPRLMGAHFILANDIDMAGAQSFVIASQEYPFAGLFDGNGHIVANFSHQAGWEGHVGLFGHVCGREARIENLGVVDANIHVEGGYGIGVLVGCLKEGIVRGCFARGGSISGAGTHVGGLAGRSYSALSDCYADGVHVSGRAYIGGLVGLAYSPGTVTNCYSSSVVTGEMFLGGLVAHGPVERVAASFWDIQTSAQTVSAGGEGLKSADMQRGRGYLEAGWDFTDEVENGTEDIWWILEGQDTPRLWWELDEDPEAESADN